MVVGNNTNLVLPLMYFEENEIYDLSFMMYRTNSNKPNEGVKIWINDRQDTIGGTQLLHARKYIGAEPIVPEASWCSYTEEISLSGYYYIIFEGISENGNAIYIDNIAIENANTCPRIKSPSVINTSASTVTINWQSDSATIAQYAVVEEGYSLNAAQTFTLAEDVNVCTIEGLKPSTAYTFYVRNNFDAGTPSA